MRFEAVGDDGAATLVTLQMSYTLPDFAAPFVENAIARHLMRYTVRRTMERFRDAMEAEAAALEADAA